MLCTLLMVALCVPRQGERIMECWRNTLPGKSTVKNCYAVSKIKYQISPGDWCSIEIPAGTPAGFTSECKFPMICLQCGVMFWVLWRIWNGHKERESGQDQSVEAAWAAEPPVQLHEVMIMFHCSLACGLPYFVFNCWCFWQGKKDVAQIFNNILRRQIGTRTPTVEYICTQQNILFMLLKG